MAQLNTAWQCARMVPLQCRQLSTHQSFAHSAVPLMRPMVGFNCTAAVKTSHQLRSAACEPLRVCKYQLRTWSAQEWVRKEMHLLHNGAECSAMFEALHLVQTDGLAGNGEPIVLRMRLGGLQQRPSLHTHLQERRCVSPLPVALGTGLVVMAVWALCMDHQGASMDLRYDRRAADSSPSPFPARGLLLASHNRLLWYRALGSEPVVLHQGQVGHKCYICSYIYK